MAAEAERALGVPVEKRGGAYGEFSVLVDGEVVLHGGASVWLGVIPPAEAVVRAVKAKLSA